MTENESLHLISFITLTTNSSFHTLRYFILHFHIGPVPFNTRNIIDEHLIKRGICAS